MTTGLHILTEGDDAVEPASSNVISLFVRPAREPTMIGEEFSYIVEDLAVRMRGNFYLPRIVALTAREDELSGRF